MSLPHPFHRRSSSSDRLSRGRQTHVIALLLLLPMVFALAPNLFAQKPGPTGERKTGPTGERKTGGRNMAEFSEAGKQAFVKFQQEDFPGAIAILEGPFKAGQITHVDLALLGSLYLETGKPENAFAAFKVVADTEAADPAVLFNTGRAAIALGRFDQAGEYLERSVAKMPLSPAARALGLLRGGQGRAAEAYRLLAAWVSNNQRDGEARLALIAAGLQINRAAEVGPLLEGLPAEHPKVQLLRGQYLSQTGDTDGAIGVLEALRKTAPEDLRHRLHGILSTAYLAAGRSRDVVTLLTDQVAGDPRLALLLASGQEKGGDAAAAAATLKFFAESLLMEDGPAIPLASQVITDYGRYLISAGRGSEALPFLEQATQLRPRDMLAWKGLSEALTANGREGEAEVALAKFREISESEGVARRQAQMMAEDPGAKALLQAQEAMGRNEPQRALAILRQEVALSPRDLRPRLLEGRLLLTLKRYREALVSAEATVRSFPDNADALYQRGVIQMGLQSTAAAESDLRRVLELAPEHIPAMNDLAVVLSLLGKKDQAQQMLEHLVGMNPDNELARDNLKKMRQGLGE